MYMYKTKLVRVIDGDSIVGLIDLGFNTLTERHIRLFGIDAYEYRTIDLEEKQKGLLAKERVVELLDSVGGEFILKSEKLDKFGRSLGVIIINKDNEEVNINQTLLNEGHAVEYYGGSR